MKSVRSRTKRSTKAADSTPDTILRAGEGADALEEIVRNLAKTKEWNISVPLPTTRELGERYHISNTTVHRVLTRLGDEGVIWKHSNGRFFLNEGRKMVERHKPYVCLLRKLQHWSGVYQGIMNGFTQAFGIDRTSMLFVHDQKLVHHADTAHPPRHANAVEQRESLSEFFRAHPTEFRGILLDEVWQDAVLRDFLPELSNAVVVCRPSTLPEISSVAVDFNAAALLAVGHLLSRGFEEIWLGIPFSNATSIDLLSEAVQNGAARLGRPIERKNVVSVATPTDRQRPIARLKATKTRVALFCLEDNLTLVLREAMAAAEIECPKQVGLLSGMGTSLVAAQKISSLRIDYEAVGRAAAEILIQGDVAQRTISPELLGGTTT